jgi:hypothetical protein
MAHGWNFENAQNSFENSFAVGNSSSTKSDEQELAPRLCTATQSTWWYEIKLAPTRRHGTLTFVSFSQLKNKH